MSLAVSKRLGEDVESIVVGATDELEDVDDDEAEWFDARTIDVLEATGEFEIAGVERVETDAEVEIKSAQPLVSNGSGDQNGRFHIRKKQHQKLLDADAMYLFVLYRDYGDEREVVATVFASAEYVERVRNSWYEVDGRETYTQIRWTTLPFEYDPENDE